MIELKKIWLFIKKQLSFEGRINRLHYTISFLIGFVLISKSINIADNLGHELTRGIYHNYMDGVELYSIEWDNKYDFFDSYIRTPIIYLLCILLGYFPFKFLIAAGTKRSHDFGENGKLQVILPYYIWLLLFKKSDPNENSYGKSTIPSIMTNVPIIEQIPSTCQHCNNPNTKQLKICEWCGGKIV